MRLPMTLTTRSSSEQPTVMTLRLMPGVVMVPRFGPHVPGCHNYYKACIPDFFDTAHQGRSLTHVPTGERADGHIDDTDVKAVALLQDEVETSQNIGNVAAAPFVQHLDRNEVAAGSNAAEPAFAGTAVPGDDAADMSAVSVIIIRQPSPPYHIKKGGDPCLIVFVGKQPVSSTATPMPRPVGWSEPDPGGKMGAWLMGTPGFFLLLWYSGEALPVRVHT